MIHKEDEFIHDYKKSKDWTESFHVSFVSKKNKLYGAVDIDYQFNKNRIEASWVIILNNIKYEDTNIIEFDGRAGAKKTGNNRFEYSIVSPLEKFRITLKNESITASIHLSAVCPIYYYPENIIDDEISGQKIIGKKEWNKYEQRCKVSGDIQIKSGDHKGKKVHFDCSGQREHIWGILDSSNLTCRHRIIVQFRDMSMTLFYTEIDTMPESNGFISKRSGNIPIINVECESLTMNKDNNSVTSSEFSFMDAQEDVDLLVGKSLYSTPIPIAPGKRKKFLCFRNFSEYTIIGTNKKGFGMEDHFFSSSMLKLFRNAD